MINYIKYRRDVLFFKVKGLDRSSTVAWGGLRLGGSESSSCVISASLCPLSGHSAVGSLLFHSVKMGELRVLEFQGF